MSGAVGSADPATSLLDAIADGVRVLEEERRVFLEGGYDRLADITARKLAVLERLDSGVAQARGNRACLAALGRLIELSRRNERLIRAAREGIAQARRRIASIASHRQGQIAYKEDGSRISCRPDRIARDRSA